MPQFLVAIQHPENYELPVDAEAMVRDIRALNRGDDRCRGEGFRRWAATVGEGEIGA